MIMIDHYKLIDLLSDRLRIEIKTAGSDLLDVLESLHRTLKEHGKADLPGLGTFYMDGNNVMFEPDPQLVMDINFRYHGMQPIILEGADREMVTSDTEVHEIPETAVFVINEPEAPLIVIETDEAVETDSPVALEELTPEVESRDAEIETTLHDQLINQLEPEPVMAESLPESPPISNGLKTPPLKWQDPHTVPINIRIDDAYVHKGDRLRKLFGVVALTLTLLAGAGFSWYNGWLNGAGVPSFHDVFPEYVTRNDPGSITLDSPTIEMQEQQQEQEQEQEQQQEQGQEQVEALAGSFGLVGPWQTDMPSYFTIVSATMFTERVANEIFEEVVAANTRARLFRVRVQGEIAWELHLGQFDTREAARQANLTLDRKFQSEVVRQYGLQ
jgi:hypothetical protein